MISILLAILKGLFTLVSNFIDALPSMDLTIPDNLFDGISGFFNGVAFFLPMGPIFLLFQIKLFVISFRIFWAIFMRIKSFIPGISGG